MEDPLPQSPYKTLNVPKDATLATIRSAHRKLVLSCHPDKVQDPAEKLAKSEQFHQVQQAYEVLSDDKRRQKYDEKVKLEELRAEMEEERRPMRRRTPEYIPRPVPPPRYETYTSHVHETTSPRFRSYEDDYTSHPAYNTARKFDDKYGNGVSRKPSGRGPEDRRNREYYDDEIDRKKEYKAYQASEREKKDRKRAKDRRRDSEMKMSNKHAYVGSETESDSETDHRFYKGRKGDLKDSRYDEPRRGSRDEVPRKDKRDARGYDSLEEKERFVREHMSKSRETIESEPPRRAARSRTNSNPIIMTPPSPVEPTRRSSGQTRRVRESRNPSPIRSSKKEKPVPEIVESKRKTSVQKGNTDSKGFRNFFTSSPSSSRKMPNRSATEYPDDKGFRPAPLSRSATAPMDQMRGPQGRKPLGESKLKNMKPQSDTESSDLSDSDSDSMQTEEPPTRPRQQQKYSFRIVPDAEKFVAEPELISPRRSDESPRNRMPIDRPSPRVGQSRTPPSIQRSYTQGFAEERTPRPNSHRKESGRTPPSLPRHQSARNSPRLYGETSAEEISKMKTKKSPKIYDDYDDERPARYSGRREAEDRADRAAWPGVFKPRPHTGRREIPV